MKDQTDSLEILNNKIAEFLDFHNKNECEKMEEKKEEKATIEREILEMQRKGHYEKLVDKTTPKIHLFSLRNDYITLEGNGQWGQVLLETVVGAKSFILNAEITTTQSGAINIGVVDRLTQREKAYSYDSGNAVCYSGYPGTIYYGKNGKLAWTHTGAKLEQWMQVRMKVELEKGVVTFTLKKGSQTQEFQQLSDILTQKNREFVPYFEMCNCQDSVRWHIE